MNNELVVPSSHIQLSSPKPILPLLLSVLLPPWPLPFLTYSILTVSQASTLAPLSLIIYTLSIMNATTEDLSAVLHSIKSQRLPIGFRRQCNFLWSINDPTPYSSVLAFSLCLPRDPLSLLLHWAPSSSLRRRGFLATLDFTLEFLSPPQLFLPTSRLSSRLQITSENSVRFPDTLD